MKVKSILNLSEQSIVDRQLYIKSLPIKNIYTEPQKEYVPPSTEIEKKLVEIFKDVSGAETIGVNDCFFELCGNKRFCSNFISYITTLFPSLSLLELLDYPTISSLGSHISSTVCSDVTVVTTYKEEKPIFCVPPKEGYSLRYSELYRALSKKMNLYSFMSQGLGGDLPALKTVESMAEYYIKEMQAIQAQGPYRILACGFGGKIALEMAFQLEEKGYKVDELIILGGRPKDKFYTEMMYLDKINQFWKKIIAELNTEFKVNIHFETIPLLRKRIPEQVDVVIQEIQKTGVPIPEKYLKGYLEVSLRNLLCVYNPKKGKKINANVLFMYSRENKELQDCDWSL